MYEIKFSMKVTQTRVGHKIMVDTKRAIITVDQCSQSIYFIHCALVSFDGGILSSTEL